MTKPFAPLSSYAEGRPQEIGKIKIGKLLPATGKGKPRPVGIKAFRFVSAHQPSIEKVAELYGGTPKLVDRKWDVETTAEEIDVILPPDPLGGTPIYELWSGGGLTRRCDDTTCRLMVEQGREVEYHDVPCICRREGLSCSPTTRLSVILPQLPLGGVWGFASKSEATAREMQKMIGLIKNAQDRGLSRAKLATEHREQQGKRKKNIVAVLRLEATFDEFILQQASGVTQLQGAPVAAGALGPAPEPVETEVEIMASAAERMNLNGLVKDLSPAHRAQMETFMENNGIEPKSMTTVMVAQVERFILEITAEQF